MAIVKYDPSPNDELDKSDTELDDTEYIPGPCLLAPKMTGVITSPYLLTCGCVYDSSTVLSLLRRIDQGNEKEMRKQVLQTADIYAAA